MLDLAKNISALVHRTGDMEKIAMQIPAAELSALAQASTRTASSQIYGVILKEASIAAPDAIANHLSVLSFIAKLANVLGKTCNRETQHKLAAAVVLDDTFESMKKASKNTVEFSKYAELQDFGREYIIDLLQEVL